MLFMALTIGFPAAVAQLPELKVVPPPEQFESSEAHYRYLLEEANGGTRHTIETVPQWLGLWEVARTPSLNNAFLDADGSVREGVLTPAYEDHFRARRREIEETGQQGYDRLTHCEPVGYPRNLTEPYVREFVNLPHQSWNMNDVANETRRVYISDEHINLKAEFSHALGRRKMGVPAALRPLYGLGRPQERRWRDAHDGNSSESP